MIQTIDLSKEYAQTIKLGFAGESLVTTLVFTNPPVEYTDWDMYLDFMLPDDQKTETPKILNNTFLIPHELVAIKGYVYCNMVYKSGDAKKVYRKYIFLVEDAIDADTYLEIAYQNIIQDLQQRTEAWEAAAASAEAAAGSATAAAESAGTAADSKDNAAQSEENAAGSATAAAESASQAALSAASALASKLAAALSESNAEASQIAAAQTLSDLLAMIGTDIATLVGGKVPLSQIPATATQEIYTIESEDELTGLTAQRGDLAELIETVDDETTITKTWQCLGDATVRENWVVWGTSYAVQSGSATMASEAENATMINNKRLVSMTESQYQIAYDSGTLDPDAYYLVVPDTE